MALLFIVVGTCVIYVATLMGCMQKNDIKAALRNIVRPVDNATAHSLRMEPENGPLHFLPCSKTPKLQVYDVVRNFLKAMRGNGKMCVLFGGSAIGAARHHGIIPFTLKRKTLTLLVIFQKSTAKHIRCCVMHQYMHVPNAKFGLFSKVCSCIFLQNIFL